jgi:hypothetical protein
MKPEKKTNNLIGKKIIITDKESIYYNEWAIIKYFDEQQYHVAIANGTDSMPIFDRDQFKIMKEV